MALCTFDGENKKILINSGITALDVKKDIYSDWKEWLLLSDNSKYIEALRVVGGDPISATKSLGATFFLLNGWKIQPWSGDYRVTVSGNLYCEDGSSPFLPASGVSNVVVQLEVSNLVELDIVPGVLSSEEYVQLMSLPSSDEITNSVWDELISGHLSTGSTGATLNQAATTSGTISGSVDVDEIVDAVWNADLSDYDVEGSAGETLTQAASGIDVGGLVDSIWNASISSYTVEDSTGYALYQASTFSGIDSIAITTAVWDVDISSHQIVGSAGEALTQAATSSGIDSSAVADAVWNALLFNYTISGSAGKILSLVEDITTMSGIGDWTTEEKKQIRYALGVDGDKVTTNSSALERLIKQNRQHNISLEEVRASSNILTRNVASGQVDYIIFKIKNEEDLDWSTPVSSGLLYAWYRTLGDTSPQYMKENG